MATLVQAATTVRKWPEADEQLLRAMGTTALVMAAVLRKEDMPLSAIIMVKAGLQDLDAEWQELLWMFVDRVRRQGAPALVAATMLLRFLVQGSITKSDCASAPSTPCLVQLAAYLRDVPSGCHTVATITPAW